MLPCDCVCRVCFARLHFSARTRVEEFEMIALGGHVRLF